MDNLVNAQKLVIPDEVGLTNGNNSLMQTNTNQMIESPKIAPKINERLDYLLQQAELFSHFVTNGSKSKNGKRKSEHKSTKSAKRQKKTDDDVPIAKDIVETTEKVTKQFDETPDYLNCEMRDYQIRALNWLITLHENGINGILADEMGLGKTLQTISMLGYLKHYEYVNGPHLIVAPNSTLQNWLNEINRFCPSLKALILIGNKEDRSVILKRMKTRNNWHICITSYEMVLLEKSQLKRFDWRYIVIDEAHRIKNERSKLSQTLRKFKSENRLLLTGTPLQNNLHELWALLNFLLPDVFADSDDFDTWFDSDNCLNDDNNDILKRLQTILLPFMLRRMKSDVEKSLRPKIELKLFVGLTTLQRETYKKVLMKDIQIINALGEASQKSVNNILIELRKAANHPYLIDGVEPVPYTTDQHLIDSCGKMMVLDKLLGKLYAQQSRVVIFSQFVIILNLLEDYLLWRNYKYSRLDGSTSYDDRAKAIQDFNAENSDKFIFILSTRAGGLGINLTTADTVIIYDSDWNPQADFQAIDRVHRIGQKKQVRVFRLITENTVDERIVQRAEIKARLDRLVIQQNRQPDKETLAEQKNIKRDMIRFGAKHILSENGGDIMDVDIEQMLKDGENKAAEEDKQLAELDENGLRHLTLEEASNGSVYQFEGVDFRSMQDSSNDQSSVESTGRPRRRANIKPKRYSTEYLEENDNNLMKLRQFQLYPKKLYELCEDGEYLDLSYNINLKKKLLEDGFGNWTETDFDQFCSAMYRYGRNDLVNIAKAIEQKTFDEVNQYHGKFWTRGRYTIDDFEDILEKVQQTDKQLRKVPSASSTKTIENQVVASSIQTHTPAWMQSMDNQNHTIDVALDFFIDDLYKSFEVFSDSDSDDDMDE